MPALALTSEFQSILISLSLFLLPFLLNLIALSCQHQPYLSHLSTVDQVLILPDAWVTTHLWWLVFVLDLSSVLRILSQVQLSLILETIQSRLNFMSAFVLFQLIAALTFPSCWVHQCPIATTLWVSLYLLILSMLLADLSHSALLSIAMPWASTMRPTILLAVVLH